MNDGVIERIPAVSFVLWIDGCKHFAWLKAVFAATVELLVARCEMMTLIALSTTAKALISVNRIETDVITRNSIFAARAQHCLT